jgi:hypothetical protein
MLPFGLDPEHSVAVDRAQAVPFTNPDGGLVLRLTARLVTSGASLFRVGYQVTVVIAP